MKRIERLPEIKQSEKRLVSGMILFSEYDKEKAECLLKTFNGMNSTQAFSLLDMS